VHRRQAPPAPERHAGLKDPRRPAALMHAYIVVSLMAGLHPEEARDRAPGGRQAVGPVIGPVISVLSFVCSIGNVPLAAVLWNGGAGWTLPTV
jgi:hypothetical protein